MGLKLASVPFRWPSLLIASVFSSSERKASVVWELSYYQPN